MDKEEFKRIGYQCIDWIADYFDQIEKYPVRSMAKPGDIKNNLPDQPPSQGEPLEHIIKDIDSKILPGITHWQHPGWFAYFPANNSPPSVLAELLTAGLGVQGMIWQTSPAAAELEEQVMEWLRQMLNLPEGMAGVIQDTASTATLSALLTARENATAFNTNQSGMGGRVLRVYASQEAHSSIDKGVKIAGYGSDNLCHIPTDDNYALIPDELEKAIKQDKAAGFIPACVVATIGSTSSTAIDPLPAIGKICKKHNIWLHVDAAFAGTAALLPEKRYLLDGIEFVDSFVFNPHKWMLTNFDCSAYFVKDPGLLIRTFEIHPEYLKTGVDSLVKNYRDWGVQLGRRFRALKLWFVIRSYGVEGLQEFIREHIRLGALFAEWVKEHPDFELLAPVPLSLVCFRYRPHQNMPDKEIDELNKKLLEKVNQDGRFFLTHTTLKGNYTIRMAIGQRTTKEEHIKACWELIQHTAEAKL